MMNMSELLLVLAPVVLVEIVLAVLALISIFKTHGCRNGNKTVWAVIVIFVQILGPIVYFLFGKGDGNQQ
ncbi:MAG: PLDc_N domain-containing protein [Lachnospiraceae bacterium]|nr:PLDc_N domain-containing protein [Lachnospiraceae bacterium]